MNREPHTHTGSSWYRDAIFYSVDVARFRDSDGNGYGDFEGLTQSLDYLAWLGVDAIWLQPFYRSPRRDNGYDVADHYEIDPRLGRTGDFVAFLREAEKRGIRVVIDLVINHTSIEHRWFQSARKGPSSPHHDWYVWTDDLAKVPDYPPIFPPEQTTTWTWDESAQAWYLHHFHEFEPDLNTGCPDLQEEIRNMVEYWIRLGVRGFRLDGAPFLDSKYEDGTGAPHTCVHDIHTWADEISEDTIVIPEADIPADELAPYATGGDAQMLFDFIGCAHIFLAMATNRAATLHKGLQTRPKGRGSFTWLNFLRHHDELTLERLSKDEQQQVFDAFAPDPDMQIYERGTRRRLAPMLDGDRRRLELAYSLLFAMPGTPMVLAGDEIGMGENLDLPGREAARLPIQWTADTPNGGFSDAAPDELVTPVLTDGPFGIEHINVAEQRDDEGSLLHWVRQLIAIRKRANGYMTGRDPGIQVCGESVFVMVYSSSDSDSGTGTDDRVLVVVHNLADTPVALRCLDETSPPVEPWLTDGSTFSGSSEHRTLNLSPYGYAWWEQDGVPHVATEETRAPAAMVVDKGMNV